MRWVEHAAVRPHRCAVLPYVGNSTTRRGFIDTGSELDGFDNHVYVSVEAVEGMARMLAWEPPGVVRELREQLAQAELAVSELEEQLAATTGFIDAVDTLESAGFRARKKPGRKPKEEVAA